VKAEAEDASAAVVTAMMRLADQIGLSPAGLKENGWAVAVDEVAARAAGQGEDAPETRKSSRDRMKVVGGGG
jgi:hypothetical protein